MGLSLGQPLSYASTALALTKGGGVLPVRGMGQGMQSYVQGFIGGAWSSTYRSRHRSRVGFTRFKVVIPTFRIVSARDADLTNNYTFQVGLEYPYTNAVTGIAPRVPVTFAGSTTGVYNAATGPFGFLVSDWITLPTPYVAGENFGLWTTVEQPQQTNFVLPFNNYGSNFLDRFEGNLLSASSNVTANTALTATSITKITMSQTGADRSFTPCMLLIDYPSGQKLVSIFGDSIADGYGEGLGGSASAGAFDTGSAYRNQGWAARGLDENLLLPYTSVALPGDGFGNLLQANAMKYRLALLALANPTHVLSTNGSNDVTTGTGATAIQANAQAVHAAIKGVLPATKIVSSLIMPRTTSTDLWTTTANQAPANGAFGGSGSNRGLVNGYIRSGTFGNDAMLDQNIGSEFGYDGTAASETSIWVANGSARYLTVDGIHPNSVGYALAGASFSASPFS